MKIFDLELKESVFTELSENDTSKICGGAGAVEAAIAQSDSSAASQVKLQAELASVQSEISLAQAQASIDQAVSRNTAKKASSIK